MSDETANMLDTMNIYKNTACSAEHCLFTQSFSSSANHFNIFRTTINMASQWILANQDGFDAALEYQKNIPVPSAKDLGPKEVLVELHAASLNYRELAIAGPMVSLHHSRAGSNNSSF